MIVRPDGTFDVLAIKPGWGASGFYAKDVLKRDAAAIVPAGLHMYANHQTAQEAQDRPEGSIHDLMAVAETAGEYREQGPQGPGVYARARALPHYAGYIEALAPHIGVSIRAAGHVEAGEADGRQGPLVKAITNAVSLDFVTKPGAGGRVLEILESARAGVPVVPAPAPANPPGGSSVDEQERDAFRESVAAPLREANTALERQLQEAQAAIAQLRTDLVKRDIDRVLTECLVGAQVHDMVRERIGRTMRLQAPVKEGVLDEAAFRGMIRDELKGELAYISETSGVQPGQIRGLGPSVREAADAAEAEKALAEAFTGLGLSADAATLAAAGRH